MLDSASFGGSPPPCPKSPQGVGSRGLEHRFVPSSECSAGVRTSLRSRRVHDCPSVSSSPSPRRGHDQLEAFRIVRRGQEHFDGRHPAARRATLLCWRVLRSPRQNGLGAGNFRFVHAPGLFAHRSARKKPTIYLPVEHIFSILGLPMCRCLVSHGPSLRVVP
jgi:hypothetical protein